MNCVSIFLNLIKTAICNITNYNSTSIRAEYFYWYLFVVIVSFIFGLIIGFIMEFIDILGEIILSLFLIFVFIVSLPLGIRRLRDIGKSPWFILIGLIPFAGPIVLLVYFCKDSAKLNDILENCPKSIGISELELIDVKNKETN